MSQGRTAAGNQQSHCSESCRVEKRALTLPFMHRRCHGVCHCNRLLSCAEAALDRLMLLLLLQLDEPPAFVTREGLLPDSYLEVSSPCDKVVATWCWSHGCHLPSVCNNSLHSPGGQHSTHMSLGLAAAVALWLG